MGEPEQAPHDRYYEKSPMPVFVCMYVRMYVWEWQYVIHVFIGQAHWMRYTAMVVGKGRQPPVNSK